MVKMRGYLNQWFLLACYCHRQVELHGAHSVDPGWEAGGAEVPTFFSAFPRLALYAVLPASVSGRHYVGASGEGLWQECRLLFEPLPKSGSAGGVQYPQNSLASPWLRTTSV